MTKQERFNLVDSKDPEIPITKQAELLNVNRSSLYYRKVMASLKELDLRRKIDELYTEHPYYGSRRIATVLNVNRKVVQRLMREMGIQGICPGPNWSR